jgi:hypothetical protein
MPYSLPRVKNLTLSAALWLCAAALAPSAQAFNFDDLEQVEKVETKERKVREAARAEAARQEAARQEEARRQAQAEEEAARYRAASSGSSSGSSSSGGEVRWEVRSQERGGGLAHWYTMKYWVGCTSGRKKGETLTIHLLNSGWYQEVYGSPEKTFAESARRGCS